jgi:hypothetical protein
MGVNMNLKFLKMIPSNPKVQQTEREWRWHMGIVQVVFSNLSGVPGQSSMGSTVIGMLITPIE